MMMRSMITRLSSRILIRSDIDFFGSPWYNFQCTKQEFAGRFYGMV